MEKYQNKVMELNIQLFTADELTEMDDWLTEFFGYACLQKVENVITRFKNVYQLFNEGRRKFVAENELEEAALADLRYEMECLFYQIKDDYPGGDIVERGILYESIRVLISVFMCIPTIMTDYAKDNILNYAVHNNLLGK